MAMATIVAVTGASFQQSVSNSTTQDSTLLIMSVKEKTALMTIAEINTWLGGNEITLSNANGNGPIRGDGSTYNEYSTYSQTIKMEYLDPNNLTTTTVTPSKAIELTVKIIQSSVITKESTWVIFE